MALKKKTAGISQRLARTVSIKLFFKLSGTLVELLWGFDVSVDQSS